MATRWGVSDRGRSYGQRLTTDVSLKKPGSGSTKIAEKQTANRSQLAALADFIRTSRDEIARRWVTAVDRSPRVKTAEDLTFDQLLDHLPQFCSDLADVLAPGERTEVTPRAVEHSTAHGQKRWRQGYRLEELVRELSVIRRDFVGCWLDAFEETVEPFAPGVRRTAQEMIHQFFDEAIAESVIQFVREEQRILRQSKTALRTAKGEVEAANRAKDHFIALVSHELRTPLTAILLSTSALIEEKSLPPKIREFIDLVDQNTHIEAGLIDDLLDASRLARNHLTLDLGEVDLHACLAAALKLCGPAFRAKRLSLQGRLEATAFRARGDERRLKRALTTLVRNAISVSPRNSKVTVTTASRGRQIEISFADSGPRLQGGALRKVFLPFEEGRRAAPFGLGGLGVSRFICKAIIEAHEGEITAMPQRGRRGGIISARLTTLPE